MTELYKYVLMSLNIIISGFYFTRRDLVSRFSPSVSHGACINAESLSRVQLFVTPWTVVHGILQARMLEWVAVSF